MNKSELKDVLAASFMPQKQAAAYLEKRHYLAEKVQTTLGTNVSDTKFTSHVSSGDTSFSEMC